MRRRLITQGIDGTRGAHVAENAALRDDSGGRRRRRRGRRGNFLRCVRGCPALSEILASRARAAQIRVRLGRRLPALFRDLRSSTGGDGYSREVRPRRGRSH
jgi:hypothetical protein